MKIFLSYAHQDNDFVPLVAKMLEVHNHRPWFAQSGLRGGQPFAQTIEDELASSEALIVVASRHAQGSTWVTTELARFRALNPDAPVIPLLLEKVDLASIGPDLEKFQAVDFTGDQLTGFQNLLGALGHDFLSRTELANRRTGEDRRATEDRRSSNVRQRVSLGLLIAYSRRCGGNVADATTMSPRDLQMLRDPLTEELERYGYFEGQGGLAVDAACVIDSALQHAHAWLKVQRGSDTVQVLRIVAEFVCDRYEVTMLDRRDADRRAGGDSNDPGSTFEDS